MLLRKLNRLRAELERLRLAQVRARDLEQLAKKLGRKKVKRGKEPTWENNTFPELPALTIPHHGGKDLPVGTKNSILNQLEDDFLAWELQLTNEESEKAR